VSGLDLGGPGVVFGVGAVTSDVVGVRGLGFVGKNAFFEKFREVVA